MGSRPHGAGVPRHIASAMPDAIPRHAHPRGSSMTTEEATGLAGQSATAVVDAASEATYWGENYGKRAYVEGLF